MESIRASIIDGRVDNVRYRQNQLHQLHATLRANSEILCNTISEGIDSNKASAETEFYLTMDSIRQAYHTLDFDQELKQEYLVAEGKDNLLRRLGVGLIAIRPGNHSRLYSIVTPIAMAIAARNCVYIEIEESNSSIDKLLKDILPKALDRDLLAITPKFTELEISQANLFLDGTNFNQGKRASGSSAARRSLAIIDRSANLQRAVVDVVNSRLSPNDRSPYSPDLIIINEFVQEEFISMCFEYAESTGHLKGVQTYANDTDATLWTAITEAKKAGQIKIATSTASGLSIIEIIDRSCPLAYTKNSGRYLFILASTGVVDTVTSQRLLPENISAYIFANASTAKFISEQIVSAVSYINHIPQQLLFGPISSPHSLHPRYTTDMFSISRPQISCPAPRLPSSTEELKRKALQPLNPTGQKIGHAVGFFEQGIFIGLGVVAFVVLPVASWLAWKVGKRAMTLVR